MPRPGDDVGDQPPVPGDVDRPHDAFAHVVAGQQRRLDLPGSMR